MKYNILFDVDSYKTSHFSQFPKDTTSLFSYIEARGGNYKETVFFGLQYFIKEYLLNPITEADVNKAKKLYAAHGVPFNYDGWMYIVNELKGYLPIKIKAVPEGTKVPISNILVSVESTDKNVPWIVSWVETALLRSIWYGTTVATRSNYIKSIIKEGLEKSSDSIDEINFKLHDFGSRAYLVKSLQY
jgi:nicotinamide phosphoribosyltransferase